MKRNLIAAACVCGILLCARATVVRGAEAQVKLGFVDMQKVFSGYQKAQLNEKTFKKEVEADQKGMSDKQEELKKKKEEFDKKKDMLKPEDRKKQEEELGRELREFAQRWQDTNQKLDKRRQDLENDCIKDIIKATQEFGKKNGYTAVLDARIVIYGSELNDVSTEVLNLLNQPAPAK